MIGAIIGDIIASTIYNDHQDENPDLFTKDNKFTHWSLMNLAIGKAIIDSSKCPENLGALAKEYLNEMIIKYPNNIAPPVKNERGRVGGGQVPLEVNYISYPEPRPRVTQKTKGHDAAIRISPCAMIAKSEDELFSLVKTTTKITHNYKVCLKDAEAVAICIYLAKNGATKNEIKERIEKDYFKLEYTYDEDTGNYEFEENEPELIPKAIIAFLISKSFDDAIKRSLWIDDYNADIVATITGAIAEAYYGVPLSFIDQALNYLDAYLLNIYYEWQNFIRDENPISEFSFITKYIGKLENKIKKKAFCSEIIFYLTQNYPIIIKNYQKILQQNGLKWDEESLRSADVETLNSETMLAMFVGILRADSYSRGVFNSFCKLGQIEVWLTRLNKIEITTAVSSHKERLKQADLKVINTSNNTISQLSINEKQITLKTQIAAKRAITYQYDTFYYNATVTKAMNDISRCLKSAEWNKNIIDEEDKDIPLNEYELTAIYHDDHTITYKGSFDRTNIPEKEFISFIKSVAIIVENFDYGDIIGLTRFTAAKRVGEIIFCEVRFDYGGKLYHYYTDNLLIEVGDTVLVPVGKEKIPKEVTIVTKEFYKWDQTPFPLENTKKIICRLEDDTEDEKPTIFTQEFISFAPLVNPYDEEEEEE